MKDNPRPISQHIRPARRVQTIPTPRHQQRPRTLRIRAHDTRRRRVRRIVIRPVEAVRREEKHVYPLAAAHQTGRLDERAVGVRSVEDLHGRAARSGAVAFHGLQHDGRRHERRDPVVAVAAVADAVAVDLVDDVDGAVGVGEAGRVDGAALAVVTGMGELCVWGMERVGRWECLPAGTVAQCVRQRGIWPLYVGGDGGAQTMRGAIGGVGGVVHDEARGILSWRVC